MAICMVILIVANGRCPAVPGLGRARPVCLGWTLAYFKCWGPGNVLGPGRCLTKIRNVDPVERIRTKSRSTERAGMAKASVIVE